MAYRQADFALDEYFHCYTRGIDGRITFVDQQDYRRFIELLFACNDERPFRRDMLSSDERTSIFHLKREKQIVAIVSYCLMPNHFHLLIREITEGGITRFMQKVGTAYVMYFNNKHNRIGGLFVKPFRSKHISDDRYLRQIIRYIHFNPAELYEPHWKEGRVRDIHSLEKQLSTYPYASLLDHQHFQRPESRLLDDSTIKSLAEEPYSLTKDMNEAAEYYRSLRW